MVHLGDTDVWLKSFRVRSNARFVYQLGPDSPILPRLEYDDEQNLNQIQATWQADPLNRLRWPDVPETYRPDLTPFDYQSRVEMPEASPQPWIVKKPGVPIGILIQRDFESKLLKNHRVITVYTPPGYSTEAAPYNILFVFDGDTYATLVPTPVILDNLIAAKRIPPTVAVLIGNGPGNARPRELHCNPVFADFLQQELVPWMRGLYNVTSDTRRIAIGGSSAGGLAAAYAGFRHPESFGNVISQSGAY